MPILHRRGYEYRQIEVIGIGVMTVWPGGAALSRPWSCFVLFIPINSLIIFSIPVYSSHEWWVLGDSSVPEFL